MRGGGRCAAVLCAAVAWEAWAGTAGLGLSPGEEATSRAWVRGNQIWIVDGFPGDPRAYHAEAEKTPWEGQGYVYCWGDLRPRRAAPDFSGSRRAWREAEILDAGRWRDLAVAVAERLTPKGPGEGVFLQLASQEIVLFRDAAGALHAESFGRLPGGIELAGRYNVREVAVMLAGLAEQQLVAVAPGKTLFLAVVDPDGSALRYLLLDFAERRCVLLRATPSPGDPRGAPMWGHSAVALGSLAIESHGCALLKNPISSLGRLVSTSFQFLANQVRPRLRSLPGVVPPVREGIGMNLAAWEEWLDEATGTRRSRGTMRLWPDGERFFPELRQRVMEAERSVHVEICVFDQDDVGVEVADWLREKSATAEVRVVLDRMCTQASARVPPATPMRDGFTPPRSISRYLERGSRVEVRPFLNPWLTADHCKLVLVDGRFAFLGGMNFGREYRHEWHDLMVEIEGPIVAELESAFHRLWAHCGPTGDLGYLAAALKAPEGGRPPGGFAIEPGADLRCLWTLTGRTGFGKAVREALRRAGQCVYVENPYLNDNAVVVALAKARRRGVDVRVILPGENDVVGSHSSNLVTANYLLKHGVRVYVYPGMSHVKALWVDGWVCLGSGNLNHLSLRRNRELNVATSDPEIAARVLRELFEVDLAKSHELSAPVAVTWTDKLVETLVNQF